MTTAHTNIASVISHSPVTVQHPSFKMDGAPHQKRHRGHPEAERPGHLVVRPLTVGGSGSADDDRPR